VSAEQLRFIHTHKTGALIRASVLSGALLMGADEPTQDALDAYSRALGLAFQIADDLLDETAPTEQMGKPAGSDRAHGKATYPALFGIDAARAHAQHAMQEAIDALQPFDSRADPLRWLAIYAVERTA
jgi:geranylgeranyl diphosphate synthase type II